MDSIILAGGKGTRLHPITLEIPKPLLTVKRKPIISYLADMFHEHGVKNIHVIINHAHEDDFKFWKTRYHSGQNIFFSIEREALGTFGAIMTIKEKLTCNEPFFVTNGDELKDINLTDLANFHNQNKNLATIALAKSLNPHQYGVAICENDKIINFLEKPENPPSDLISSGLYIMDKKIFEYFPHKELQFAMLEKDLFPQLAEERQLGGFKFTGKWHDCGTFERWEEAINNW